GVRDLREIVAPAGLEEDLLVPVERDTDPADRRHKRRACRPVRILHADADRFVTGVPGGEVDRNAMGTDHLEYTVRGRAKLGVGLDLKSTPTVGDGHNARLLRSGNDPGEQLVEGVVGRHDQYDLRAWSNRVNPLNIQGRLGRPAGIGISGEV